MAKTKVKTVKDLTEELANLTKLVHDLQKDLAKLKLNSVDQHNVLVNNDGDHSEINCNKCKKVFTSKRYLKIHMKEEHTRKYKCKKCDFEGNKISEIDEHVSNDHGPEKLFKCSKCNDRFLSEIRLNMHSRVHQSDKSIKFCHYFNNGKSCPFEKYGCKFKHADSEDCKYKEKCNRKLCPFKHKSKSSHEKSNDDKEGEIIPVSSETEIAPEVEEKEKYEGLEHYEAREIFCDNYCSKDYNIHNHTTTKHKKFKGVNISEAKGNFPCDTCEYVSSDIQEHRQHFDKMHEDGDYSFSCVFNQCEFETTIPEELVKHTKLTHYKFIEKILRRKCRQMITG